MSQSKHYRLYQPLNLEWRGNLILYQNLDLLVNEQDF